MLKVIECLPSRDNLVVSFKEVKTEYILQDNEYIVDFDFEESLFTKNYNVNTGELTINNTVILDREIFWRNSELERTDSLMLLSDYPYKEQLTVYRQALRDWPATEDFPDTRPELVI